MIHMSYLYDVFMAYFCTFWSMTVPGTLHFHCVVESSSDVMLNSSFDGPHKKECHTFLKCHVAIRIDLDS